MDYERALDTLIHECLHAVDHATGVDLDESEVTSLGTLLHQILKPILDGHLLLD
jgi:hypothetical protein